MSEEVKFMSKDMTKQILMVTAEGEFIWHSDADDYIENGDACDSFKHILRALRKITKSMTKEEIDSKFELDGSMFSSYTAFKQGVRWAEKQHGIGGDDE